MKHLDPASSVRLAARLVRTHRLLVVCGYDGTLAPLTGPDEEALPVPAAVVALRMLAGLRGTDVAVVSRRSLRDLATLSRLPAEVRLIGRDGREVELGAAPLSEPDVVTALRAETSATAVLHIRHRTAPAGGAADLAIAVGTNGITDSTAVARFLATVAEERRAWETGGPTVPIERLTMLGNGRTVALVTPSASVTWFCCPMPDSPALFASLLGGADAGHFSVFPEGVGRPLAQRYLPGTMTVETRWSGLKVTDYLGHDTPPHRTDLIRVIEGNRRVRLEFAPRPEFGNIPVRLGVDANGLRLLDTVDPVVLRSPGVAWEIQSYEGRDRAVAWVEAAPDEPVVLELRCGSDDLAADPVPESVRRRRAGEYWSRWRGGLRLPGVRADLVDRSALTLRGLCHRDHGGILAAATTSLPEEIGGVRNWDYRYCWLRDGAMTAKCLVSLGSYDEAEQFLAWLRRVLSTVAGPERLHPLYTIAGTTLGPEATLERLPGYAASRPVRVGNLAEQQVQLDVFGPVADLVAELACARGELRDDEWELVRAMATAVERRWHEPDHGIWEERARPRHHVYSKVMCWVTIDRLLALAARFGREVDPAWSRLRDRIADDVLSRGWHNRRMSYTTAYGDTDLDASVLHIGLSGLLPTDDPRFAATVNAVEAGLRQGPTVYRYLREDGLPGGEGGFHLCTAWLVEAYLCVGRVDDARELFKHLADAAGPTGLLPEEYDPVGERSLGNHPQAYSHLGLVRCAQLSSGRTGLCHAAEATPTSMQVGSGIWGLLTGPPWGCGEPQRRSSRLNEQASRLQWADVANGACIVLVALWHVIKKHCGWCVRGRWGSPVVRTGRGCLRQGCWTAGPCCAGRVATNERPCVGVRQVRFGMAELERDPERRGGWLLSVGGVAQSYVDVEDPTYLEFPYQRHTAVALHCVTGPRVPLTALHIGGGACTLPRYLEATRPGSTQVVVDADAELVDLVRTEFGIDEIPGLTVRVGDGREYLHTRAAASADLVILDAYERSSCVGGMVTVEATRQVARLLRPHGVAVVNVIDVPGLAFARRVAATMTSVYDTVVLLVLPNLLTGNSNANLVLVGAHTLPTEAIARLARITRPAATCLYGDSLAEFHASAAPLTDDEPVDGPRSLRPRVLACG